VKYFLLLLLVVFAPPQIQVNWVDPETSHAIAVSVSGLDEMTAQCKRSGLEVRYRFEVRYCQEAYFWSDPCERSRLILHSLQFDPISQTFRLSEDRLGDNEPPQTETIEDEQLALKKLASIPRLELDFLAAELKNAAPSSRGYVGVRLLTQCKGVNNETLERLSYFLSLGMVRTSGFDSGWVSFKLQRAAKN
jgi:hypothetical protein